MTSGVTRQADKHERDRADGRSARGRFASGLGAGRALALAMGFLATQGCSKIPPGRSAVDSVRILNAKALTAGEIEEKLGTQASTKFLFLFQGVAYDYEVFDESVLQRDMARIERLYRAKGFFDAHARAGRVFRVNASHVRVEIAVEEGQPTINRNVTVVGLETLPADVAAAALAAARDGLPRRSVYEDEKFTKAQDAVKTALTDRGYAYADVGADAEVDIGEHVADYGFKVVPGPRATIGHISIVGLEPGGKREEIPEGPMRRAINIKEGSVYSTAALDSATRALLDLNVFSSVQIIPTLPTPPPADHVVPLTVKVEPTRLRRVTFGGGIEFDQIKTDIHGVAGWEDHNFLGGLRDFNVNVRPGAVIYPLRFGNFTGQVKPLPEVWLKTSFRQPGFIEARTTGFIRPEANIFPLLVEVNPPPNIPVVGYREVKIPVGVDRTFWRKLFLAIDYTFQLENPFAYVQTLDPSLETVVLSYPELRAQLDFRDSSTRPHEGVYIGLTAQTAGGIFGGSASDVRVQPDLRTYLPLARGVTLATRASIGFLWASNYGHNWNAELERSAITSVRSPTDSGAQIDARTVLEHDAQVMYFRGFFSGGPTTNRGFPLLGVSPHGVPPFLNPASASQQEQTGCNPTASGSTFNPTGCWLPAGGFTLWELQNEVRVDVNGPLSAAVFCDMGDVSPYEGDFRMSYLHLSCGLGAAYDTPVGPIRFDLGYRVQPLQILGYKSEQAAFNANPVNGEQPTILNMPLAVAIGIGEAF